MVQYIVLGIEWLCRGAARSLRWLSKGARTHRDRQMMREIERTRAAVKHHD